MCLSRKTRTPDRDGHLNLMFYSSHGEPTASYLIQNVAHGAVLSPLQSAEILCPLLSMPCLDHPLQSFSELASSGIKTFRKGPHM